MARRAGITPGLVHYYFPSKHDLLLALFDRLAEGFARRLEMESAGPEATVRRFVDRALALGDDADPEGVRAWGWLAAEALHDAALRDRLAAAVESWLERLAEAFATLGAARPGALAGAVVSGVVGAWQLGAVAPGVLPPGSAAGAQARFVEALLDSLGD